MQVPAFLTNVQTRASYGLNRIMLKGQASGLWIKKHVVTVARLPAHAKQAIGRVATQGRTQSDKLKHLASQSFQLLKDQVYTPIAKPQVDYFITPLGKSDALYIITSAVAGIAIGIFIVCLGGKACTAPAAAVSSFFVFGAMAFAHQRVLYYYNREAAAQLQLIEQQANNITLANKETTLPLLSTPLAELNKKQFAPLKEDIKALTQQLGKFMENVRAARDYQIFKDQILLQLNNLKESNEQLLSDIQAHLGNDQLEPELLERLRRRETAITINLGHIEALKTEIDKVGSDEQSWTEIEKKWLKMQPLWNNDEGARMHNYAYKALRNLNKACHGPQIEEAKKTFLNQLEAFQKKLV
ncbi:MAG: hypothetical protein LW832_08620 [Parachlamydia sp.]|nr:hypothetical protein [Parachlamydia sp.]